MSIESTERTVRPVIPKVRGDTGIRPLRRADISQIANLIVTYLPHVAAGNVQKVHTALDLLQSNPRYEDDSPSLVYESPSGKIEGFLGVSARSMIFNGQRIRAAVCYDFIVDYRARNGLIPFQLLRTFFSGDQDVILSGSAGDNTRKLWQKMGGITGYLYSTYWTLPLRPLQYGLTYLNRENRHPVLSGTGKPIARISDTLMTHFPGSPLCKKDPEGYSRQISGEELVGFHTKFCKHTTLRPDYTVEDLQWVLGLASKSDHLGSLECTGVFTYADDILGWFVWYSNPGGTGEVLQLHAREGKEDLVLDHLVYSAWKNGLIALSGRVEPPMMEALGRKHCLFSPGRMWMVMHSRHQEILNVITRGDAFLSRLEGDLWIL
ncbi:MAG TPA: hypothetical protein VKA68_07095 [bacterium]|nr:hypothetical protein [bacterium]